MDGYNLDPGAKDYGKVVETFDWISFLKKPSVIVKMTNVLLSIIVFGCIFSQGWHYDVLTGEELCIINSSYSTCTYAISLSVLAFIFSIILLYGDYIYTREEMRKQYVKADFCISGLWAFLYFACFCNLAKQWHQSVEPASWYGHSNVAAAVFFTFVSTLTWGMNAYLGVRRFQATPNAFQGSVEEGSVGGYQSFD